MEIIKAEKIELESYLPKIAIVGQTNVGKSSLFNNLVGHRRSITATEVSTTRDTVVETLTFSNKIQAQLMDTAGQVNTKQSDSLTAEIADRIDQLISQVDLVIVVAEAVSLTTISRQISKKVLKSNKPSILVITKSDLMPQATIADFVSLAISPVFLISNTTRSGLANLRQYIKTEIQKNQIRSKKQPDNDLRQISIGLIGRPNAGKSSLFNVLAGSNRALVSSRPGTTRDVNSIRFQHGRHLIEVFDAAGVRRQTKINSGPEKFSVWKVYELIKKVDICLLLLTVEESLARVDLKLANHLIEADCGVVLTMTKSDLINQSVFADQSQIERVVLNKFQFSSFWPVVFISSQTGDGLDVLLETIISVDQQRQTKLTTNSLNQWLAEAIDHKPPPQTNRGRTILKYITQTDINPPTLSLWGRRTDQIKNTYRRYLTNHCRNYFELDKTTIKLVFNEENNKRKKDGSSN